jgi:hypothetical protein
VKHLIFAFIGFIVMFGALVVVGINKPRGTSTQVWLFLYLAMTVILDGLVVAALLYQIPELTQLLLGLTAGSATGLAIHVWHHIQEENEEH